MSTYDRHTATRQHPTPAVITGPKRANDGHCNAQHIKPPHKMSGYYTLIRGVVKSEMEHPWNTNCHSTGSTHTTQTLYSGIPAVRNNGGCLFFSEVD